MDAYQTHQDFRGIRKTQRARELSTKMKYKQIAEGVGHV
jgi:hypothetical protein